MFKSFQTIFWLIVFGLAFANTYAQLKPDHQQGESLGNSPKSLFLNPEAECVGAGELKYDDGTFENGYGWNNTVTDGRYVMLFTPTAYPWNFNTICIALSRLAAGPSSLTFDVVVYDNSGAGGAPGNLVATVPGLVANAIPIWSTLAWYDFDISSVPTLTSGSYYIGAKWNASTLSGLVAIGSDESTTTTLQTGYSWANAGPWTLLTTGFPDYRAMGIRTLGNSGPPCPVVPASNPIPASGTTNVNALSPGNASWTNGAGTTNVEVFFGPVGNVVSVYSGTPITTLAIPAPLQYNTTYQWRVVCKNDTCSGAPAATWSFTTNQDPGLATLFVDDFESGIGNWTITNDGGTLVWQLAPAVRPLTTQYTLPPTAVGTLLAADIDQFGVSGQSLRSTAQVTAPINASIYQTVNLEFDNDWRTLGTTDEAHVEVSINGGTTWTSVWSKVGVSVRNTHEVINMTSSVALTNFLLRFRSVQPTWDWWWVVDNVKVIGSNVIPVELVSFAASVNDRNVTLNWSTATELNNSGFQIERSNGSEYQVVGFVAGHGTTTETKNYSYSDQNVNAGNYTYRLKQVDFNGTFEYSNVIEVEVLGVKEFALGQNYPNPFNPSTTINFSLAVDSKVSLKIFDVLGQEVATLLNGQMAAGSQKVSFDASSLNSGVYFYRIDADGIDGQKFSSVKKMILTK